MPCTPVSARVWSLRRASGASRPSPGGARMPGGSLRGGLEGAAQGAPRRGAPGWPPPPPQLEGPGGWPRSRAWGEGRLRAFQDPQRRCRGAVRGPPPPVPGFGVAMAGAQEPWGLVTTALDL
jgi:hypothetical protein